MATDYLKYKAITYKNDSDTAFVYAIIDKNVSYPTIVSKSIPHYELINKDLSANPVSGEKRIYIYYPKQDSGTGNDKSKSLGDLNLSIELMVTAKEYGSKILSLKDEKLEEMDDYKSNLYSATTKFNSKVAKSKVLRDNSQYIHNLYVELNNHPKTKTVLSLFGDDESARQSKIIEYACDYKNNLGGFLNASKKRDSIENDGLNVNTNMSVLILSIMDLVKDEFDIDIVDPVLHKVKLRGKNQEPADWSKGLSNNKIRLKDHFFNSDNKDGYNKLVMLAYSINYYLENLFEIIYERDDCFAVIADKKEIVYEETIENMQYIISKFIKKMGYKDITVNIKDIVDKGDSFDRNMTTLVNNIINDFSKII